MKLLISKAKTKLQYFFDMFFFYFRGIRPIYVNLKSNYGQ